MKVKEKSEKAGLKLSIQKTKIMASGPITSWQIDEGRMKTVAVFIFLGSKIAGDSDWSREIKRCLLLGGKAMTNLDSVFKSRDIILLTDVCLVKAVVFVVVMYGCESWTIKKAECWRIDIFELWCWKRLLRVPWTARRSNQSIRKEINPEYGGFPCSSVGKESACSAGDPVSITGLGRSPGEGKGNPLQYPCWKISWTEEPWGSAVHGVAESQAWLSD